ncbi:MAG: ABC transporter permease [Synergistaceae bacterium]|nr:ABC transporter permease [Synergistaceae bacterium]
MIRYIGQRLLMMIPVILGISLIIFSIMDLTKGDPARLILGEGATLEAIEAKREELGLNDHFIVRYVKYIAGVAVGDFGRSYRTDAPVSEEIFSRFPTTFYIAFLGILFATLFAIPAGVISAVRQYSAIDVITTVVAMLLTSMPGFFVGMLLILVFALMLRIFPATGISTWKHFILPSLSVASVTMANFIRMTRSTMLEVIRQDYIRTARAKGASVRRVIFTHCLRNSLLPVVTVIGINFGVQLGGTIMIEAVFAIPGLGTYMINAIRQKDIPAVMGSVIFAAIVAGIVNLAVDIMYAYIDPRVKSHYERFTKRGRRDAGKA